MGGAPGGASLWAGRLPGQGLGGASEGAELLREVELQRGRGQRKCPGDGRSLGKGAGLRCGRGLGGRRGVLWGRGLKRAVGVAIVGVAGAVRALPGGSTGNVWASAAGGREGNMAPPVRHWGLLGSGRIWGGGWGGAYTSRAVMGQRGFARGGTEPFGAVLAILGVVSGEIEASPQRGENMAALSAPSLPGMPRGPAASAYTSGYASAPLFPTLPVVPRAPPSLPVTPLPFRLHFPSCPSRRSRRRPRSRRGPARPAPARLGAAGDPGGELMSSGGRCGGTRRPTGARRGLPRPSAA